MLETREMFIFSIYFTAIALIKQHGEKLTRFKISAGTFAGEYFTEETEKQNRYNFVQIEVSFVCTGRGSDKIREKDKHFTPSFLPMNIA